MTGAPGERGGGTSLGRRLLGAWRSVDTSPPEQALRRQVLLIFLFLISASGLMWGTTNFLAGNYLAAAFYGLVAALLVATVWIFRKDPDVSRLARFLLTVGLYSTVVATWISGGLRLTNVTPYFMLLVASFFLLGRAGVPWALGSLAAALGFQALHWLGFPFPDVVPPDQRNLDAFVTWFTMAVVLLLFTWAYELARHRMSLQLQEADATRAQFIANISHELRAPLHVLTSVHELLRHSDPDPRQQDLLRMAQQQAQSLGALVDDLLEVSRVGRASLALAEEDFDPLELVEGVARVLRTWCEEKGLGFELVADEALPRWVNGDDQRLRQVLLNLGGNAVKFTQEGRICLRVEVPAPDHAHQVRFSVSDTGIGIDPADQERIFESFVQVDGSLTRAHQGAGLGLYISSDLVTRMGGEIHVESEPGQGSTFSFTLPLPPGCRPRPTQPAPRAQDQPPGPCKVLVVDDSEASREVVQALLELLGHEPLLADSAQAALEQWEQAQPDLVLMDLQMPQVDGLEATCMLREREADLGRPPVTILAMTGHSSEQDRAICLEAGMDGTLFKPFTLDDLRQALDGGAS